MAREKCKTHKIALHYRVIGNRPKGKLSDEQRLKQHREIEWFCPECKKIQDKEKEK